MENVIEIKYVGKKPSAFDNVAGSRKCWNGQGDVQEVTPRQAKTLLKYPDQWQLVNPDDADSLGVTFVAGKDEDGNKTSVQESELKKPIEKMKKDEIVAYALDKWGKELDPALPKAQMVDQCEEWENTLQPLVK